MQNMPNLVEEVKVGSVGLSDPGGVLNLSPVSQNEEPVPKKLDMVEGHPCPPSFTAKRPSPNLDAVADRLKIEKELEARQKALLQSFGFLAASQYNPMLNTSSAFTSLPPNLLANNGQLAALASVAAATACAQAQQLPSPSVKQELSIGEPEDLSMRSHEPDESGVNDDRCESAPLAVVNSENGSDPDGASQSGSGQPSWSYEEQFKQLYELSEDGKRKEWLDDWLSFMHRIGKPVTRIPIMAKQVLDLYELYRLVVSHGGLVEIINKKLWREITKGLNLPSSITSAAFTLRTQYQKYLYDYECEKEGLSSLDELQAAIDGNKREGRRSGAYSTPYAMPPTLLTNKHMNGGGFLEDNLSVTNGVGLNLSALPGLQQAASYREQMAIMEVQRQMERVQSDCREAMERQQQQQVAAAVQHLTQHRAQQQAQQVQQQVQQQHQPLTSGRASTSSMESDASHVSAVKRPRLSAEEAVSNNNNNVTSLDRVFNAMSSTHIKATNRNDGSMVVSMEINGVMYQGLLFAQVPSNNNNPSG